MRKFAIALLTTAAALAMVPAAMATTVNFNCPGSLNGVPCTTNPGTQGLTSWSQGGFTVTPTAGSWSYNGSQGNPQPGISSLNGTAQTVAVATAPSGGVFDFDSVDLGSVVSDDKSVSYSITGNNGFTTITGTLNGTSCTATVGTCSADGYNGATDTIYYFTIRDAADSLIGVTALDITLSPPSGQFSYVDNIVVTPEPASLLLLGTGLLGLAFVAFRKAKSSGLTLSI